MVLTSACLQLLLAALLLLSLSSSASAEVQFSFCQMTGNVLPITASNALTFVSGLFVTTATSYKPTGTYTVTSGSDATLRTVSNGLLSEASDAALSSPYEFSFSIKRGSAVATLSSDAELSFVTEYGYVHDYSLLLQDAYCTEGLDCGHHALLQVQLYTPGSALISCAQPVSFSFCIVSAFAYPPSPTDASTLASLTAGVLDTAASSYSATGTYTATSLSGQFTNVVGGVPQPPVAVDLWSETQADQTFTLQAGTEQAVLDRKGLGFTHQNPESEVSLLLWQPSTSGATNIGGFAPLGFGEYGSLFVQRITAAKPAISCAVPPFVQFSFCLLTGTSNPPSLAQPQSLSTLTSGILTINSILVPSSGSYTVLNISQGLFSLVSNGVPGSPIPAWLGAVGGPDNNDNVITFSSGSSEVQVDSSGLDIVTSQTTLNDYYTVHDYVDCTDDDCGAYSALYVQPYTGAASAHVACSPVVSLSSSPHAAPSISSSSSTKKK